MSDHMYPDPFDDPYLDEEDLMDVPQEYPFWADDEYPFDENPLDDETWEGYTDD